MAIAIPDFEQTLDKEPPGRYFPGFPFRESPLLKNVGPLNPPLRFGTSSDPGALNFLRNHWGITVDAQEQINNRAWLWGEEAAGRKLLGEKVPVKVDDAISRQFWSTYVQFIRDYKRYKKKPFMVKWEDRAPLSQENVQRTNFVIWHGPLQFYYERRRMPLYASSSTTLP